MSSHVTPRMTVHTPGSVSSGLLVQTDHLLLSLLRSPECDGKVIGGIMRKYFNKLSYCKVRNSTDIAILG